MHITVISVHDTSYMLCLYIVQINNYYYLITFVQYTFVQLKVGTYLPGTGYRSILPAVICYNLFRKN